MGAGVASRRGFLAALAVPLPGRAEERAGPEPLMDNGFLIEEACSQEAGVVQQIATFGRDRATRAWTATLMQEWPVPDQANQLSYTLSLASDGGLDGPRCQWRSTSAGQGLIWLATPRLNPLVEVLWTSTDLVTGGATTGSSTLTVSPGVRWGVDLAHDLQIVLGLAVPLGLGPSAGDRGIFLYLSVELPFWHPADAGVATPPRSST